MKLDAALYILRKIAAREIRLREMVFNVDEQAIYAEMSRRWFAWSGQKWIQTRPIALPNR